MSDLDDLRAATLEPRMLAAWREWLSALATDAEAALAAAHVYGDLAPDARNAWLDALAEDSPKLAVSPVAVYAPLLGVEEDPVRRARIERSLRETLEEPARADDRGDARAPSAPAEHGRMRALRGRARGGVRVVVLVAPLYLQFVRMLVCAYTPTGGFDWVRHEPMIREGDVPSIGETIEGAVLEATPLKLVVEELAHAVLAQRRRDEEMPSALHLFVDLFDAQNFEDE